MLAYGGQILEQALLLFPMVVGIYLSFSVLRIADLTVDGTFVCGAAIFATLLRFELPLTIAFLGAVIGGGVAGCAVAIIQRHNRIDPLIAGILMAFILHSLSLIIMQRPNTNLLGKPTIFGAELSSRLIILISLGISLSALISIFLSRKTGLKLKAFGNNQHLVSMLGFNPEQLRMIGLAVSNALAALSGALTAQASGYADINMGFGQALIGIAMILIGRQLMIIFRIREHSYVIISIGCTFLGVILYFLLTNELIRLGLNPIYLKMAIGGLLIAFLWIASDRATHSRRTVT